MFGDEALHCQQRLVFQYVIPGVTPTSVVKDYFYHNFQLNVGQQQEIMYICVVTQ